SEGGPMTSALPAQTARDERPSVGLPGMLFALVQAMRPAQWQKNGLLFAAFIFSNGTAWQLRNPDSWIPLIASSAVGFALFRLSASGAYLLNDVVDVERDRMHSRKRHRPIASGRLPVRVAVACGIGFPIIAVAIGMLLDPGFGAVLAAYVVLTL